MDVPSLLIIGNDAAHRAEFLARLCASSATADTTTYEGASPTLRLDTKYYTATVALVDAAPESAAQHPAIADAEGVILLFTRHDASSFDAARDALQSAELDAEVQLCVCDGAARSGGGRPTTLPDSGTAQPAACNAAQQWAAQELYEYIEVDTADAAADAALQPDGEPQGMRRVLAALEAHTWSGLRMKPAPSDRGRGGDGHGGSSATPDAADHAGHGESQQSEMPTSSDAANGSAGCSGVMNGSAHQHAAEPGPDSGAHEAFGSFLSADDDPDPEDEADRSFSQLMGQMTGVRERLRGLPDSERRAGAEQIALQMMQLLGMDGSDDGTEDSGDAAPPSGQQRQQQQQQQQLTS